MRKKSGQTTEVNEWDRNRLAMAFFPESEVLSLFSDAFSVTQTIWHRMKNM